MPTFPRYESKSKLTTQIPSVLAPADTSGQILEQVSKVAGQAQDTTSKFMTAMDLIQTTHAKANLQGGVLDIIERAEVDQDYNAHEKYVREIRRLKTDNLKGFASKSAESAAAIDLGLEARRAEIQLGAIFKKKLIDVGQTAALRLIDAEINNPGETSLQNIRKELSKQVEAGIFSLKDAYVLEQKANENLGVNRISKDLYEAQNPEMVDLISEGITNGYYERGGITIDPEKKKSLLEIADRARTNTEKKLQAQYVEAQAKNRVETIAGVASGEIKLEALNIRDIAEYDPELGTALTRVKEFLTDYNPKIPLEEQTVSMAGVLPPNKIAQARTYAKSVSDVFMHNDNGKLGEFVLRELKKKGDGTTSSVKLAAFMRLAALKLKANNPQTPQDSDAANRLNAIKVGIKFLQSSNPYLAPTAIGDFIVRNFLSGTSSEEQVVAEAKSVLKSNVLDRYKAVSKLSSVPNKIVEGEALVESLHSGLNEVEEYSGSYGDQDRSDY